MPQLTACRDSKYSVVKTGRSEIADMRSKPVLRLNGVNILTLTSLSTDDIFILSTSVERFMY